MGTDFLDGISDDNLEFDTTNAMDADELRAHNIRKAAHIANGGESEFTCPACRGSGVFRSYTGRVVGKCFKCNGKKTVSKGVAAAAKGKATKEANRIAFADAHRAEYEYLSRKSEGGFRLAGDLLSQWAEYGRLTDGQVALVRKLMGEDAARAEERKAEREAAAPVVDLTAIDALFATATENQIKRPVFRADGLTLSKAPLTGRNAGALYVKDENDTYLGKLMGGKFHSSYEARGRADIGERLQAIAADPTGESIKYARKTGRCGCCGKMLVDPVSILAGIGPICASKWGLDWKRDLARTEYAEMKAEEIKKIKE